MTVINPLRPCCWSDASPTPASCSILLVVQLTPAIEQYAQKKVAHAIQAYQSVVNGVDVKLSVRGGDASKGEKCALIHLLLSNQFQL
jgi:hypothetical protein